MIKKYLSEIIEINNPAENIYTVTFKRLNRGYKYKPGQFLHLAIDEYDGIGQWPESRCFSMHSSPDEELLKITYSVKGQFTNRMAEELHPKRQVWLKMPYGDLFQQQHKKENTVFIAGGTGITPYLSLFASSQFAEYKTPKLYFGVRNNSFNIYEEELKKAKEINKGLEIYKKIEEKDGMLNIQNILESEGKNSDYFISGPPLMISNFKNYLIDNIIPEQNIKTDDWE